ncbi:hypothetical protein L195_g038946, partial [Trifolium pratense]
MEQNGKPRIEQFNTQWCVTITYLHIMKAETLNATRWLGALPFKLHPSRGTL